MEAVVRLMSVLAVLSGIAANLLALTPDLAGHHWYPLCLVAISLPATLAGANVFTRSQP